MMPYKDPEVRRARHREYMRKRYAESARHREKQKARVARLRAEVRKTGRDYINAAKAGGCLVCEESFLAALDFHHVDPRTKSFSVSAGKARSVEQLQAEIEKCVVLCANCHRKFHAGVLQLPEKRSSQVAKVAS